MEQYQKSDARFLHMIQESGLLFCTVSDTVGIGLKMLAVNLEIKLPCGMIIYGREKVHIIM